VTRPRIDFDRAPLRPDRIRHVREAPSFAFLPHRFLRDGFWASLEPSELLLYFLLVLVADRQGMSFYFDDRLASMMRIVLDRFVAARNGLLHRDLITYDPAGPRYQVLALPERPVLVSTRQPAHRQPDERRSPPTSSTGTGGPVPISQLICEYLAQHADDHDHR